eukprot:868915-Alexandrium_andersonii.AAC.1
MRPCFATPQDLAERAKELSRTAGSRNAAAAQRFPSRIAGIYHRIAKELPHVAATLAALLDRSN